MEQVQKYWVERNANEQALRPEDKHDERTPMRILETYCDRYGYTPTTVAEELDYRFFEMDYAEEAEDESSLEDLYSHTHEEEGQE